jgi:signal transduction histidine kinase
LGQQIRVDNEVYWHANGHPIAVIYATHPMVKNGEITGAVTSFVDISEQRAAGEARERALIAAENLARVRSEFLANMSHEIRTPLNGVLGFADIGQRNYQNPEKALNAFAKILSSGQRLLGVINDILDFSKIEAGKLSIEQTEVCLREVIQQSIEILADRMQAKKLDFKLEIAPDLPSVCLSDPLRIGQVLLNILSNAVKFTETGSVSLSVSRDNGSVFFKVSDSGIGISEQHLSELFSAFHQADASASRRFGGTGLGLAISKRILELMGGHIRVESQLGQGSTVLLQFAPAIAYNVIPGKRQQGNQLVFAQQQTPGRHFHPGCRG